MSQYTRKDRFYDRAKKDDFAARSVYKLEELDRRFSLIRKGARVVDLGCAPGSWLQYIAQAVGSKGLVLGYDLAAATVAAGANAKWLVADVHELTPERIRADLGALFGEYRQKRALARTGLEGEAPALEGEAPALEGEAPRLRIDALVSDMAPKLTGVRDADQVRSVDLATRALDLAEALVAPSGIFVAKLFQGRETDLLVERVKRSFEEVRLLKPEATREGSREVFVVGRRRRAAGAPGPVNPG
jgi:23S rRNA (uridine2552-2'-O)-methyltransferase